MRVGVFFLLFIMGKKNYHGEKNSTRIPGILSKIFRQIVIKWQFALLVFSNLN